jgi:hypothetical protein
MNKSNAGLNLIFRKIALKFFLNPLMWHGNNFCFLFCKSCNFVRVGLIGSKYSMPRKSLGVASTVGVETFTFAILFLLRVSSCGYFFLTPVIRRIADFRLGNFTEPSPILPICSRSYHMRSYTLLQIYLKTREQGLVILFVADRYVIYGYMGGLDQ